MKKPVKIALAAVLVATAVAVVVVRAQSPSPQIVQEYLLAQSVPNGGTWKVISDDVRLLVFRSDRGDFRGRLYVNIGGTWQPVAAEGLGDLKGILPVK